MARRTDRRIRHLGLWPVHRNRKMARITGAMKCQLVGQRRHRRAARILKDRYLQQQFRLLAGFGVAITTSGNTGTFRIRIEKLHSERGRTTGGPIGFKRWMLCEFSGRLCRVMAFDTLYRPGDTILATIMLDVIECHRALFRALCEFDNLGHFERRSDLTGHHLSLLACTVEEE